MDIEKIKEKVISGNKVTDDIAYGDDTLDQHPEAQAFVKRVNDQYIDPDDYVGKQPAYSDFPSIKGKPKHSSVILSSKNTSGIDTIKLHTNNYAINPRPLTDRHGHIRDGIYLKKSDSGAQDPEYSLKWVQPGIPGVHWLKGWTGGITVILNIPKALKGNNLTETRDPDRFLAALQKTENRLWKSCGIELDLLNASVTGLELTRTEEMPRYVSSYSAVFNRLSYNRMDRTTYQNGNVLLKNDEHSITFYDKKLKRTDDIPGKRLRIEYKIWKGKQVRRILNSKYAVTPVNLYNNWESLILNTYNIMVNKVLSKATTTAAQGNNPDVVAAWEQAYHTAKADGEQAPYIKAVIALGLSKINGDELQAMYDIVKQDESSQRKYYFKGKMEKCEPYADAYRTASHTQLLDELDELFTQ